MPKIYENGLFIFHRDLRIKDNVGLLDACKQCKRVFTCFIFTPEQVGKANSYKSNNAVQFMIESLDELSKEIAKNGGKLILLYGPTNKMIEQLVEQLHIDALFFNRDYTPYAIKRDADIQRLSTKLKITCNLSQDYYLHEPGTVKNGQNGYYHKFTPFYEKALTIDVDSPRNINMSGILEKSTIHNTITIDEAFSQFTQINADILVSGGRENGIARLRTALPAQKNYNENRDNLDFETTLLSAYIKFGCVSIREVFHAFKKKYGIHHEVIRELIWRDFFAHILFAYPDVLGHSYNPHFEKIKWKSNAELLNLWKKGMTGFPVVDACMRQLNATGYMHNRGRMIVATFLVKTLLLDWREGEKYFAKKLTDYDVASNNGNWSSIVGGGVYAMPYFRIMNPWIQSAKFDQDAIFCKKWIPELRDVLPKDICKWYDMCKDAKYHNIKYPCPIVDYQEQKEKALKLYHSYV